MADSSFPRLSRRAFGLSAAGAALMSAGTGRALAESRDFPSDFVWGCATAAYQIEGAVNDDGRGPSIWDVFAHTPGKIAHGDTGDVACDSYHRFREDTQLLRTLGAKAYRFSLSWSRIFPEGRGTPNSKGMDHYKKVVDDLLENGIDPYVTLYHWDLPAGLKGGWQNRATAGAFADYAEFVARHLSDRVHHFMTTNELRSFVDLGHQTGIHAPGLHLSTADVTQVRHNALLAHGLGVQAIRAAAHPGTLVGLAENPLIPVPVIETADHIEAARKAMRSINAGYLTAILEGRYDADYLASAGTPKMSAGDMQTIGTALDFVGLNVYAPIYVAVDPQSAKGFKVEPIPGSFPRMSLPWLMVGPEAAYWAVRLVTDLWRPKTLIISENGCAADDKLVAGLVEDTDRLMFLRNYITQLRRAVVEGYPIKGYFAWSLMDNFEWAEGYSKRFGLHYVDFSTQQRIPKLSAAWYRELIKRNALV